MKKKQAKNNKKATTKNEKFVQDLILEYSETFTALAEYDKQEVCALCGARKINN